VNIFLAPKKIDQKLLDPKCVFKDISPETTINLFSKKKRKPNREGYDTDSMLLFKKCSVTTFIHTEDPIKILAEYNVIAWEPVDKDDDMEEISLYQQHPDSTEEIKECLKDIKVLNAKDFKLLLKWRLAMRKFAALDKKEELAPEPVELTDEQKHNLIEQEIEDKIKKEARRRKKKMHARLKKNPKNASETWSCKYRR